MLKKLSIRLRLTVLSILLLTICCVGLTVILNISANKMANVIEAIALVPITTIAPTTVPTEAPAGLATSAPTNASQDVRNHFSNKSILYMAFVVLVGGLLTYYLTGKALLPLQELNRQMKNRTVHNLSESLPIPEGHDEIADLTHSFNEMTTTLNDAFSMQKRFSQSAAHELRTPLTVLKTKVDVFKKKKNPSKEEYENLISIITSHTNRLADLVKDLLNLTNMDVLECNENISIKNMLQNTFEELSSLTKDKNIAVAITGDEQFILGNESLLHRAFYNLIENAIKYNVEHGCVQIAITSSLKHCVVTITDTGIGIPAEMQELIFEAFFRVDKSRSRQMGGSGLGLSIVKTIIDKHHGQISVLSNPCGGSIFEVSLPLKILSE